MVTKDVRYDFIVACVSFESSRRALATQLNNSLNPFIASLIIYTELGLLISA